ncbi:MAG TPA: cation diffusion facilitator family transporter [Negativicutes bacterium]|nr:cation diffusion facilitator family transporter [Negativicutes bacterium]
MNAKDNVKHAEDFKAAEKWAIIGIVGNLVLTAFKAFAGIVGGSSAMVADAMHSASDIVASAVVYVSLKIAKKPADKEHPYGHGKAEAISAAAVGLMLIAAGFVIIKTAYTTISSGSVEAPGIIALYAAIASIVIKEAMYRVTYKVGKRINSPSTIANALDHRSDAFSSIATFIGIGGAILGFPVMDPIAGGLVALFILKMGYDIVADAANQIMDKCPGNEKLTQIEEAILSTPGVQSTHDIRIRQSGPFYLVDLDICVNRETSVDKAHEIADIVRNNVYRSLDKIFEVRVHVDPHIE